MKTILIAKNLDTKKETVIGTFSTKKLAGVEMASQVANDCVTKRKERIIYSYVKEVNN